MPEQKIDPHRQSDHKLASELAERWVKQLLDKTWQERLNLLADLFEHMRESVPDFSDFCDLFPDTVAGIIYRLGDPEIAGIEQAHLYASSRDPAHRGAAGEWFRRHGAASSSDRSAAIPKPPGMGGDPADS